MRYNVRGIPTLLLFKGGKVVEQKVGAVGKADVQKMLDAHTSVVVISSKPATAEVKTEPEPHANWRRSQGCKTLKAGRGERAFRG